MLLIIFLGLIAKLALVSAGCDIGTWGVDNFDWAKYTDDRFWYYGPHSPIPTMIDFDCPINTHGGAATNTRAVTNSAYSSSSGTAIDVSGTETYVNSSGYYKLDVIPPYWVGDVYAVATDYNRYFVGKVCNSTSSLSLSQVPADVYVLYRDKQPDTTTVQEVEAILKQKNIDINKLVENPVNHCKEVEAFIVKN